MRGAVIKEALQKPLLSSLHILMYVCVLLNATCVCCYIMYSNFHNRSVFLACIFCCSVRQIRFLVQDWFLFWGFRVKFFFLDAFCPTHTDSPTGGTQNKAALFFLSSPLSLCLFLTVSSFYLRNDLVHHIVCVWQPSVRSCHMYMETLKMSLLHIGVETLYCPLPVSRPTNGMSEWEGWREGGHYFKLTLSKCIHSPFFFFLSFLSYTHRPPLGRRERKHSCLSHRCAHTYTHTYTPSTGRERERERPVCSCHKICVFPPLQLPITSKNKPSVSKPEPIR